MATLRPDSAIEKGFELMGCRAGGLALVERPDEGESMVEGMSANCAGRASLFCEWRGWASRDRPSNREIGRWLVPPASRFGVSRRAFRSRVEEQHEVRHFRLFFSTVQQFEIAATLGALNAVLVGRPFGLARTANCWILVGHTIVVRSARGGLKS